MVWAVQPAYSQYLERSGELTQVQTEQKNKEETLAALQKSREATKQPDVQADIERYAGVFKENTIIDSLFVDTDSITIGNVGFNPGQVLPNGLSYANISVAFDARDIPSLNAYLEYLTSPKGKKRYVVENINFPIENQASSVPVSLALGMYYLR